MLAECQHFKCQLKWKIQKKILYIAQVICFIVLQTKKLPISVALGQQVRSWVEIRCLADNLCQDLRFISARVQHRTVHSTGNNVVSCSMTEAHRRISCKDLGGGDCQGWLLMKKTQGRLLLRRKKWNKFWFVLAKKNLYYYRELEVSYGCPETN